MDITRRSLLGAALAGALDTIAPAAHAQAAARGAPGRRAARRSRRNDSAVAGPRARPGPDGRG